MQTKTVFKIKIIDIPQGTPIEKVKEAIAAGEKEFNEYPAAEAEVSTLTMGKYRIEKQYHNVLS